MSHVHGVVILVGVGQHVFLETREDLRHRSTLAGKLLTEPSRQFLCGARGGDLAVAGTGRFEVAGRHRRKLFSNFERGVCLQLGENVIDHAAKSNCGYASSSPLCRTKSASSPLDPTLSLTKMFERWVLTVRDEI